jgi:hypothetical protein
MRRIGRVVRIGLVVAFVAFCGYAGFSDGFRTWSEAQTAGQRVATAAQLTYAALSVVILLAMALRPEWVERLLYAWGAALTVTGSMATVVWGGQGWGAATAAAVSIVGIVALVVWAWRAHRRASDPAAAKET